MAEPPRYLLDTSALLAHFRQEAGWDAVQALFESEGTDLLVASVSLTEFGHRIRDLGASDQEVDDALTSYQLTVTAVVDIDAVVARAAVVLASRTPDRLPLADALIAAAAQVAGAVLVHRDAHMRTIPGELVRQQEIPPGSAS